MLVFFNDTATTEIYTLSLHDALPISAGHPPLHWQHVSIALAQHRSQEWRPHPAETGKRESHRQHEGRSEEHTSELHSRPHLVCRLRLEKKTPSAKLTESHTAFTPPCF